MIVSQGVKLEPHGARPWPLSFGSGVLKQIPSGSIRSATTYLRKNNKIEIFPLTWKMLPAPPPHSMPSATEVMKMLNPKSRATIPAAAAADTSSAVLVMNQV